MEDERRALPHGWVRRLDERSQHQFFVDTLASPPRSIWHHPYDDEDYLATLSSEERERLQEDHRHPSMPDVLAMSSDEEDNEGRHFQYKKVKPVKSPSGPAQAQASSSSSAQPSSSQQQAQSGTKDSFGRRMKDKLTNTTHEQRQQERVRRAEEERQAYERHMKYRQALVRAIQTGEPQSIGRDREGREVFVEPPPRQYGYGYGSPFAQRGYGTYPYNQGNGFYAPPGYAYGRPRGNGFGGGYGLPLAGGMIGGLALGGLLGGF